ncbi:MAG: ABC transporter ATP-binding protein [Myxococcota bacterium]
MVEPVIRFRGVQKAFGPKVIYEDCTLDVFPGETLTIIGGSGTGKSVLLKMLTGLLPTDAGSIRAFGQEVTKLDERGLLPLRKRIGFLFQSGALFDSLTVSQNIKYPLREHRWGTEKEMDERVAEVLDMVGLPGTEHLKPAALSGGMRKRVGLARAIAMKPEVILYDEPTTGLDPINVRRINGLILSLQRKLGVTSIVVTHDMDSCFTVTDRIAMLYNKRIAFVGTAKETEQSEIRYVREFIAGGRGTLDEDID